MVDTASAWDVSVDGRIELIANKLGEVEFEKEVPGLKSLLDDYLNPNVEVDHVDFHRGLLATFKKSETDDTYQKLLAQYTKDERERLESFVDGKDVGKISQGFVMGPSLGAREEVSKMMEAKCVEVSAGGPVYVDGLSNEEVKKKDSLFHKFLHGLAEIFDFHQDKDSVKVYPGAEFQNWGLTVTNVPQITCVPKSVTGIRRIIKYAMQHDLSVRCSGFRHSWSPIFGRSGHILISMLQLHTATHLPNTTSLPVHQPAPTELESIEVVPGSALDKKNTLVRVGCAVTNERLRRWCIKNKKFTIPLNVIMVEITLGGSNAPICHGAGRSHKTLSDLVRRIEYVDAFGKLRTVDKMDHLRAASGCFGLMGIVTHITLEFSPMTYAEMNPVKMPVMQAVPLPPDMNDEDIPKPLFIQRTAKERQEDQEAFEKRATSDYYCEWFWFPYSDFAWVNCWNTTTDSHNVVDFPNDLHIFLAFVETVTMNVLQNTPLLDKLINAVSLNEAAVTLISRAAMFALQDKPVKTYLTDALHFQRAIQNVRVRDIEVEMPLLPKQSNPNLPDYTIVQRAWWDAILKVYKNNEQCPMRMPLEMRIMGGSEVVMAPQRHNTLGTCSIEVLTLHSASKIWHPFAQEVLDAWMKYRDPATGKPLNIRPHWAKEWKEFTVDGKPWAEKLKNETYKAEIEEFNSVLEAIGKEHGWTRADLKKRFSNDFFDDFFFSDVDASKNANGVVKQVNDGAAH